MTTTTNDPAGLLAPREVALLFGVTPKTVTRWARRGRLEAVRTPGGHRRFRRADVEAFLGGIAAAVELLGDLEVDPSVPDPPDASGPPGGRVPGPCPGSDPLAG